MVEKQEKPRMRNVSLAPLVTALRNLRYAHIQTLAVSGVLVDHDAATNLVSRVTIT